MASLWYCGSNPTNNEEIDPIQFSVFLGNDQSTMAGFMMNKLCTQRRESTNTDILAWPLPGAKRGIKDNLHFFES